MGFLFLFFFSLSFDWFQVGMFWKGSCLFFIQRHGIVRMQAYEEEYELKQMKDMAAARKRWEALVFNIITSTNAAFIIFINCSGADLGFELAAVACLYLNFNKIIDNPIWCLSHCIVVVIWVPYSEYYWLVWLVKVFLFEVRLRLLNILKCCWERLKFGEWNWRCCDFSLSPW